MIPRQRWTFWKAVGVAAIAIVVIAVGVGIYTQSTRADASGVETSLPKRPVPIYEKLRVSILGDSYSLGIGSASNNGYAQRLANRLCWNLNNQSEVATGYVAAGDGTSYAYEGRTNAVIQSDPDLILVQGSMNDAGQLGVFEAARATFAALRAGAPNAVLIAVGSTSVPGVPPEMLIAARDETRAAAEESGVIYIDPIDLAWLPESWLYGSDLRHPTDRGHEAYADSLRKEMDAIGLPIRDACDPI